MDEIREEHWRDVAEDGNDRKNIYSLMQYVYIKQKEQLIIREFFVSVLHLRGGNILLTCVKDNRIKENEHYKYIGLRGFDYKLFEEEEGGGLDMDDTCIII